MIAAIVAVDADWGIGYNGELLEKIPQDMKRFKDIVTNKKVIVGRKTWNSIPPTRSFLTRNVYYIISSQYKEPITIIPNTNMIYCHYDFLLKRLQNHSLELYLTDEGVKDIDVIIIGGESIYKQFLPYCNVLYITRINKHHENVDTYFPDISSDDSWKLIEQSELKQYKDFTYRFETYKRL